MTVPSGRRARCWAKSSAAGPRPAGARPCGPASWRCPRPGRPSGGVPEPAALVPGLRRAGPARTAAPGGRAANAALDPAVGGPGCRRHPGRPVPSGGQDPARLFPLHSRAPGEAAAAWRRRGRCGTDGPPTWRRCSPPGSPAGSRDPAAARETARRSSRSLRGRAAGRARDESPWAQSPAAGWPRHPAPHAGTARRRPLRPDCTELVDSGGDPSGNPRFRPSPSSPNCGRPRAGCWRVCGWTARPGQGAAQRGAGAAAGLRGPSGAPLPEPDPGRGMGRARAGSWTTTPPDHPARLLYSGGMLHLMRGYSLLRQGRMPGKPAPSCCWAWRNSPSPTPGMLPFAHAVAALRCRRRRAHPARRRSSRRLPRRRLPGAENPSAAGRGVLRCGGTPDADRDGGRGGSRRRWRTRHSTRASGALKPTSDGSSFEAGTPARRRPWPPAAAPWRAGSAAAGVLSPAPCPPRTPPG